MATFPGTFPEYASGGPSFEGDLASAVSPAQYDQYILQLRKKLEEQAAADAAAAEQFNADALLAGGGPVGGQPDQSFVAPPTIEEAPAQPEQQGVQWTAPPRNDPVGAAIWAALPPALKQWVQPNDNRSAFAIVDQIKQQWGIQPRMVGYEPEVKLMLAFLQNPGNNVTAALTPVVQGVLNSQVQASPRESAYSLAQPMMTRQVSAAKAHPLEYQAPRQQPLVPPDNWGQVYQPATAGSRRPLQTGPRPVQAERRQPVPLTRREGFPEEFMRPAPGQKDIVGVGKPHAPGVQGVSR